MIRKLVWLAGIAGYFTFDLAVGSALPGPLVFIVLLVALLIGAMALALVIGMRPRRFSPDTRFDRLRLLGAFFLAGLVGAILGIFLPLGVGAWLPIGVIGLALLGIAFKMGSMPREAVEESASDEA
jgi:hypothetical protein